MTWGFVAIAGATVVGGVLTSNAARDAANTQANASVEAGNTSLAIAEKQIIAQKDTLAAQLAAEKDALDKQLAAQQTTLNQTLAAQKLAADTGNTVAKDMLNQQLAAQQRALDQTLGLQREMFNKQIENLSSYKEAGEVGQTRLLELLGLGGDAKAPGFGSATTAFKVPGFDPKTLFQEFNAAEMEKDPGYAFRVGEGQKAIERSTAARGGLQSGAALKAAAEYGQSMGSQEYGNAYNRFMANKAFQSQEFGNAFNRFTTERGNQLAPLVSLQGVGQAAAAGQANAAGNLASGGSQAIQGAGAGTSTALANYGSATGNIAANLGAGTSAALGNFGSSMSNAYAGSGASRQSAYGNFGGNLTNIYANQGAGQINAITGAANARAAGQIGSANAFNSALSTGVNLYGMYNQNQLLNKYLSTPKVSLS